MAVNGTPSHSYGVSLAIRAFLTTLFYSLKKCLESNSNPYFSIF